MGKGIHKLTIIKILLVAVYVIALGLIVSYVAMRGGLPILQPEGAIASQQRDLLYMATGLMLLVVVPVFILTIVIPWKYRAGNKKATHEPEWDHNRVLEAVWWGFPLLIIVVLAIYTYMSSHQLDPYKQLESNTPPVKVQVIALQWKWLFIYPEHGVAVVNELDIPEKTPINFQITSDAPMNSFWIPSLGGQVYAMTGMTTKLHLIADKTGTYNGSSSNLSGEGFAGMKFKALSMSETDFNNWVQTVKRSSPSLNEAMYNELAKPSKNNKVETFVLEDKDLYDTIIMKYMAPHGDTMHSQHDSSKESH